MALGAKFVSRKVQCCGEKVSRLYCCYIASPRPLTLTTKTKKKNTKKQNMGSKSPFFFCFPVLLDKRVDFR